MLPAKRLRRTTDPSTSTEAACQATRASLAAANAVARILADGIPRIDEEIWEDCRRAGYCKSLATIQRGRLALFEAGYIVETGQVRPTSLGGSSREWVYKACDYCPRCHKVALRLAGPPGYHASIQCRTCGVVAYQVAFGEKFRSGAPPTEGALVRALRVAALISARARGEGAP